MAKIKPKPNARRVKVENIGRVSSASVEKGTGKSWDEWISILDRSGAKSWDHGEIVKFVARKFRLTEWWRQGVASGYEIHIGRKVENRNDKGQWSLTATKTLSVSKKDVWSWLCSEEGQAVWLKPLDAISIEPKATFETEDGFYGEVRTMRKGERVRLSWRDPEWTKASYVSLFIVARPESKSILVFQHEGLPTARHNLVMRDRWKRVLDAVKEQIAD